MYELYYEHFIELGKTCMKFAKYFDQHRTLTTRGDTFFSVLSDFWINIMKSSKKPSPQFLMTISLSEIFQILRFGVL